MPIIFAVRIAWFVSAGLVATQQRSAARAQPDADFSAWSSSDVEEVQVLDEGRTLRACFDDGRTTTHEHGDWSEYGHAYWRRPGQSRVTGPV